MKTENAPKRWCNMRAREKGMSMPSGDSASCAFLCTVFWTVFNSKLYMFTILPLTMCGRVYVYCHWFGDTIVGALIGVVYTKMIISYLPVLGYHLLYAII